MRRALLAASLMLLACTAAVPPSSAQTGACRDQVDNDGDGRTDWTADPGCSSPDDNDERSCSPQAQEECWEELTPCVGMGPPMALTAEWTDAGLLLDWAAPVLGDPVAYLVYRVEVSGAPVRGGWLQDPLDLVDATVDSPLLDRLGTALPVEKVRQVTVRLQVVDRVELSGPGVEDWPHPLAAVSAQATQYLDQTASLDGEYLYWVQAVGPECRSAPSNMAVAGNGMAVVPPLEDCFYLYTPNPPQNWTPTWNGPNTACLEGSP
jgi:hypothetical protein